MEQTKVMMKDQMIGLVKDTVETLGYTCVEARVIQNKGGRSLKIIIYKHDSDISMEDCTKVSNVVQRRLELESPDFSENYDMLVESPGVERKIETPEELAIFRDREIRFVLRNASNYGLKDNVVVGRTESVNGDTVRIRSGEKTIDVPWKDISQAKLFFDIKKYL